LYFCGKNSESKTKEHIIPQWLIKYTGDPNRMGIFDRMLIIYKINDFAMGQTVSDPACPGFINSQKLGYMYFR
jgi:hypothetical protein